MFTLQELRDEFKERVSDTGLLKKMTDVLDDMEKSQVTKSVPLSFGKYKGKTIPEIFQIGIDTGVNYCRFIMRAKDKENEDVNWIEDRYPEIYYEAEEWLSRFQSSKKRKSK